MTTTAPAVGVGTPAAVARVDDTGSSPRRRLRSLAWRPEWLVVAAALAPRLTVIFRHGGLHGLFGYDAGVYFAGADSLVHGRLPYLDYVQLHPPAITVAVAPFALLTHVMSDGAAFTIAILAFTLLGAVNAVLVMRVCRRLGLGNTGAVVGGLVYALWLGSVDAEFLIKLEPLANLLILCALLLALRAERFPERRRMTLVAGLPLGLAVSVKIWWIVPVLAIIVWHGARTRSVHRSGVMAIGAVLSAVALDLPFFAAAPRQMWSMVVLDQLARPRSGVATTSVRLQNLAGVTFLHLHPATSRAVFVVIALGAVLAVVSACRVRAARAAVVLLAVQVLIVLAAPSWFPYYTDFLAVGVSIVAGATIVHAPGDRRLLRRLRIGGAATLVATAATITATALGTGAVAAAPFPAGPALTRAVASARCVMTDSPAVQIRLDALTRGLADGCPNWVDVTGPTYGKYRSVASRGHNPRWQRAFLAYLRRGQAIILVRGAGSGATPALRAELAKDGGVALVENYPVYRMRR